MGKLRHRILCDGETIAVVGWILAACLPLSSVLVNSSAATRGYCVQFSGAGRCCYPSPPERHRAFFQHIPSTISCTICNLERPDFSYHVKIPPCILVCCVCFQYCFGLCFVFRRGIAHRVGVFAFERENSAQGGSVVRCKIYEEGIFERFES